jgi:hypothetical protein
LKDTAKLVTLEILDAAGKVIRRFASDDKPELLDAKGINVPTYWVRQVPVVSGAAGMHRWVWDLRYPKPKSFERDYPISAIPHDTPAGPLGPFVVPGEYTVRLTVDGVSTTKKLKVRMDPRVLATMADLQAMLVAERRAATDLNANYDALQQIRALRKQLKALKDSGPDAVRGVAAQVEDQLGKLESGTAGKTPSPGVTAARGMATVHSWLNQVYGTLDSADAAPTVQALAMLSEVEKVLAQQLNEIKQIQAGPLAELNQKLRQAGTKEISQSYEVNGGGSRRGELRGVGGPIWAASIGCRALTWTARATILTLCDVRLVLQPYCAFQPALLDGHPIPNTGHPTPSRPRSATPRAPDSGSFGFLGLA